MEKQGKVRKLRLTLKSLLDNNSEIWVVNKTGKMTTDAGNIVFQVGSGDSIDVVVIPPGNDPVCLTDQVDPQSLATCRNLFTLVKNGGLELLDPEDAEKYYDKNQERKLAMEEKIKKLLSNTPDEAPLPRPATMGNISINQRVGDVCLKAKHKAIDERQALETLMEQVNALKFDDYNYLISNGVFKGVKAWAREQLTNMTALPVDEITDNVPEVTLGSK